MYILPRASLTIDFFFSDMISKDESAHSTFTELITRKNHRSPSPHFKCNGGTHIPLSALKDISNYSPTEVQVSKYIIETSSSSLPRWRSLLFTF